MKEFVMRDGKKLRLGYTTGSCAAAAAKAAAWMLLSGSKKESIRLLTPKGMELALAVENIHLSPDCVRCAIRKDSGDDPDITRDTLIYAEVRKTETVGIVIDGGQGIGRVTKPGLDQPVGAAAINSVPRRMIRENVEEVCGLFGYTGGLHVMISAPDGETLAKKTFNPRLGIEGGISILGTTGIVEPMSEQALVDTIHVELRQRRESGADYVLLAPGNYGADYIKDAMGIDIGPLPRMTYQEAMEKYGSDKPDTRYGMEIFNLADEVKDCGFAVFTNALQAGGGVHGICAKGAFKALSRKELDKLIDHVKGIGGKGIAWIRMGEDGSIASSFKKFMTEEEMAAIIAKAGGEPGDVIMIISGERYNNSLTTLGQLRITVAKKLDLIPKGVYKPLWIVEFPFFDWDEETQTWVAMHHPFTAIVDECLPYLEDESRKGEVRAQCYDMVLNGIELASGSIRITDPELQNRVFELLGLTDEEAHQKFGHLIDAFQYGAPPHGGMALGLDRVVMQLLGAESLRDVLAFPKVQNASEPMTNCPDFVDDAQLDDLSIAVTRKETEEEAAE